MREQRGEVRVPERSGRMRVKVRAVVVHDGKLVIVSERRRGAHSHFTLPGGRIGRSESVEDAVVREVAEETGLDVVVEQLLYVAEVTPPHGRQELTLVFLATITGAHDMGSVELLDLDGDAELELLPPLLAEIRHDHPAEWRRTPRWLGNVWDVRFALGGESA